MSKKFVSAAMTYIQTFTFNPFAENTYILYDEESREAVLVDPGCYTAHERDEVLAFIRKHQLSIVAIWNTHCHLDHVFGNHWAQQTFQAPLLVHEQEQFNLDNIALVCGYFGFAPFDAGKPDAYLKDGDILQVGTAHFQVLHTPGHSPGHVVFYNAAEGYCINGDVLFRLGIGRTDLPGGNHQALVNSIRQQMYTLPDNTLVYTGHGESTTIGFEKQHNPFVRI